MKNYNVEIRESVNDCWDAETFEEAIPADSALEAAELAKAHIIENGGDPEAFMYKVTEVRKWDEEPDEGEIF